MEEILIPMLCLYDIPSLNHMSMPSYKKGDIFMFNPDHEIHIELFEHDVFQEIDNKLCKFICQYPSLFINGTTYEVGEEIADKDIQSFSENDLKNLYWVGYIQKVLIEKKPTHKSVKNNKPKKKAIAETYAMIARKFGLKSDTFKKTIFELTGIEIKDLRKKVPTRQRKKIIEALSK